MLNNQIKLKSFHIFNQQLDQISVHKKLLINTINAHSYNLSHSDSIYQEALLNSNVLIPDGISIVWAIKWLKGEKLYKISGADLFFFEMSRLQKTGGKCFFLGSTTETLKKIRDKISIEFPKIIIESYSPPFKDAFTDAENSLMLAKINSFKPDVLLIGMTAPKQEKWAYQHYNDLLVSHICCIGAVFDFYAGTFVRAPQWMIDNGLEWLYRFIREPKRMWKRYLIGNLLFVYHIVIEKIKQ